MTGGGSVIFNTTNNTSAATYSGVISGNGSVAKQGVGNLNLSGNNTYTGNTTISGGVLIAGSSTISPVGSNGVYSFTSAALGLGTIKVLSGASFNPNAKSIYNPIEIAGNGAAGSFGALWSQAASGTSAIYGNVTLTADNPRFGSSDITLSIYGDINSPAGNTYGFSTAGPYFVKLYGGKSVTGNISVGNGFTFQLLPNGSNATFSNNFTIASGSRMHVVPTSTYSVTVNGAIGGAGDASLDAGTGVIAGWFVNGTYDLLGNTTLYNNGTLTLNSSSSYTLASNITTCGTSATLAQAGSGTLTIASNLSSLTGTLKVNAGSTLNLGNGTTSGATAGNINVNGTLNINRSDSISMSNVISGTGLINKLGSNVLTLSGANTFTGNISIQQGTLKATTSTTSLGNNVSLTISDVVGAGLEIGYAGITLGSLAGGTNTTLNLSTYSLTMGSKNLDTTFAGTLLGSGTLTKVGTGNLTLSGNSSAFTGNVILNSSSTLVLTNTTTFGNASGELRVDTDGGVLQFQNVTTVASSLNLTGNTSLLVSNANSSLTGKFIVGTGKTAMLNVSSGLNVTLAGNVSLTATSVINKTGDGTVTLSGNNSAAIGTLNVSKGLLIFANNLSLGKLATINTGNITITPAAVSSTDTGNGSV
jgi:autotransporter-associated beta strand protein